MDGGGFSHTLFATLVRGGALKVASKTISKLRGGLRSKNQEIEGGAFIEIWIYYKKSRKAGSTLSLQLC